MPVFSTKKAVKSKERPAPHFQQVSVEERSAKRRAVLEQADAAFREWAEQRGRARQGMNIADILDS